MVLPSMTPSERPSTGAPRAEDAGPTSVASIRNTVGGIGVAIVLAFVLRAFLVEAFVIPTGSMAPELMGEHYDLLCPHCGYEYDYGFVSRTPASRGERRSPRSATCPNCRRDYPTDPAHRMHINGGDRVLVLKYLYDFDTPDPWDVAVFRNPQNNRENFIKRIVGLPGETIEIIRGDIWVKPADDEPWRIRRKPRDVQNALWDVVYDNDYPPKKDPRYPGGPRWQPADAHTKQHWDLDERQGRLLRYLGKAERAELIFESGSGGLFPFFAYNDHRESWRYLERNGNRDVCTDLQLSAVYTPHEADSRLAARFDVWGHRLAAEIVADGTVRLWRRSDDGQEAWFADGRWQVWQQKRIGPFALGRGHRIAVSNVDYRLALAVDGRDVLQSTDDQYGVDYEQVKRRLRSAEALPMTAVAIDAGGGACDLLHVRLDQDVYYTDAGLDTPRGATGQYIRTAPGIGAANGWEDARGWGVFDNPIRLQDDAFFVLGDNSPQSLDSRRWVNVGPTLAPAAAGLSGPDARRYQFGTVLRRNLIGKAVFVYWPAGFRLPGLPGLPLLPNVGKMRMVR